MYVTPATLTPAQLDGIACVVCADESGPMIPVDVIDGGQVFAHRSCAAEGSAPKPASVLLVVGKAETEADVADLMALAYDAADRFQMPATVATGRDIHVKDYEGVILADTWTHSVDSVILGSEARTADMFCVSEWFLKNRVPVTTCGLCEEDGPTVQPVAVEGGWSVGLCPACAALVPCAEGHLVAA
ncbi:hypothetical protein [Streptomyces sp. NPDC002491]